MDGTSLIDQAVGGITLFNTIANKPLHYTTLVEVGCSQLAAIRRSQVAILRELIGKYGHRGYANPLKFAKQHALGPFLPNKQLLDFLDESIGSYILDARNRWSGPKRGLYTEDFLTFMLIKDDGPLFAEFLSELDPTDERNRDFVLDWADEAIELNASNVVWLALDWAYGLRDDALTRAVVAMSADVVRLLLSDGTHNWTLSTDVVLDLLEETLSERVLRTIVAIFERPPPNLATLKCRQDSSTSRLHNLRSYDVPKARPLFEPLKTQGPLTATETRLRRRALDVIDRLLGPFVRTNLPAALPALCALGRAPDATELRAGVSECGDPRRLVRACVAAAARAGDARVAVEVLEAGAALQAAAAGGGGGGGSDAVAVTEALRAAYEGDRAEVAERVLEWAAGPGGVSPEELEDTPQTSDTDTKAVAADLAVLRSDIGLSSGDDASKKDAGILGDGRSQEEGEILDLTDSHMRREVLDHVDAAEERLHSSPPLPQPLPLLANTLPCP
ncbi:hypothetical protein HK405_003444 [Cladochytrium tenue]|nr:hypothetical protein HK405_003444 [Cladochytrium tenue]